MLDKNITYEVLYEGVQVGEIKGNIYYDINGRPESEVRDNFLFNGNDIFAEISRDAKELIMTRKSDGTVCTITEKK